MTITEVLLPEFDQEMASTRRILERLPEDKFGWRPHEKSSTLGKLENHLAAIPVLATFVITRQGGKPAEATSTREILRAFDENVAAAREAIAGATDAHWTATITVSPTQTKNASDRRASQNDESPDSSPRPTKRVPSIAGCRGAGNVRAVGG